MTTVDTSVQPVKVLMVLARNTVQEVPDLPEGYRFAGYEMGMEQSWQDLLVKTGLAENKEAKQLVASFLSHPERFVFVTDAGGNLAGCAGLWEGDHFGSRLRLHEVAVDPAHQGKGIAKALVAKVCRLYDAMPSKYPLYAATQSGSWPAIVMYSRLGFTPYLGEWKGHSASQSEADWQLVTDILREKAGKKD